LAARAGFPIAIGTLQVRSQNLKNIVIERASFGRFSIPCFFCGFAFTGFSFLSLAEKEKRNKKIEQRE
jgi:hypothetical protein